MAKYEITAPDGGKYEITAPDTATPDEVTAIVARQFGGGQKQYEDYKGWGDYGKDLARVALGQGGAMSFGDEAIAGVRSMLPESMGGADYQTALQQERDAVARFRQKNPGVSVGAELIGSLATPGLGAGRFIASGANTAARMARGAVVGAGFGAVNAAGAVEGMNPETYMKAVPMGMATGGAVGAIIPGAMDLAGRALRGGQSVAQRMADNEQGAQLYFADKLRQHGMTEQDIAADLNRGQHVRQFSGGMADLPETIADVSPVTQRVLRGIRVGGGADDIIEPVLGGRQAGSIDFAKGGETGGQLGRLDEAMRLAMRSSKQELIDQTGQITAKQKAQADRLFGAARAQSQPFDIDGTLQRYAFEAMNLPDPQQQAILNRALSYFTQQGRQGKSFPVDNIDRFDKARQALGDLLGQNSIREQGNLYRLLTSLKHDLLNDVFRPDQAGNPTLNTIYKQALNSFASKADLLDAAELGKKLANGSERLTQRTWSALSEPEKAMVRKAYRENKVTAWGNKPAGEVTDFTGPMRTENFARDMRVLLPPQAGKSAEFPGGNREKLAEIVRRERRIATTNNKVLGGSQTADKQADTMDVGRLARATRYVRDAGGLGTAAIQAVSDTIERLTAIRGERARYLAQNLLSADPAQQQAFLQAVANAHGRANAQRIGNTLRAYSNAAVQSSGSGYVSRREGERANRETRSKPRGLLQLGGAR